jgi:mono/diheme cytochrome c family protein
VLATTLLAVIPLQLLAADPAAVAPADPAATEKIQFFEKQVRPLLSEHCVSCHGPDAQEGELRVDSRAALIQGGSRGPSIIPGDPKNSLLVRALGHGETLQMPPKKKLPADRLAAVAEWIKQGAHWPAAVDRPNPPPPSAGGPKAPIAFSDKQLQHWSFQPLKISSPPAVGDRSWPQSPIDQFILADLEQARLEPNPKAARHAILRRVTFDLLGLPPRPDEVVEFTADDAPDALARRVDRLLASPRHGEKYGRHWLDLARYADSNGLDENLAYANAFRYRDYVIASLNRDKPYDRFLHEQLAGDLLPHESLEAELEGLVATGFLSLGAKMLAEDDPVKMRMDIIDEQIDTIGKCFLGLTLGCARCHDHKYDPVDMRDYYSLAGVFLSTRTMVNYNVVAVWQERPVADRETRARRDSIQQQIQQQKEQLNRFRAAECEVRRSAERERAGDYLWQAHAEGQREQLLTKIVPYGGRPAEQLAQIQGLRLIEAEDYQRGNVNRDKSSYGAGIGVLVNRGETPNFAEYDLELSAAGLYRVELRYAAADARPCRLFLNGQVALPRVATQATGSWQPDGQKWFVEGWLELKAGRNTLRLEHPQFFPHIDKLLLAPATPAELGDQPRATAEAVAPSTPAATTASSKPDGRAEELVLLPAITKRWHSYLQQSRDDPASPLAIWHAVVAGRDWKQLETPLAKAIGERLQLPAQPTVRQVAQAYQRLFRTAQETARTTAAAGAPSGEQTPAAADDLALAALRTLLHSPQGPFAVSDQDLEPVLADESKKSLQKQRDELSALEKTLPAVPEAMAVIEQKAENARIHYRGNHLTQGEVVPRRYLRVIAGPDDQVPAIGDDRSGRLEWARWLTRPDHPLTSRVIANRLWQWHFGQALVRSPDNFGLLGEAPTHPALLDWLAREFMTNDWSWKRLHRELILTQTYALSTTASPAGMASDPENRLHWHAPRRRLAAEEIRDSILLISDQLSSQQGGSYLPTPNRQYVTSTANVNPAIYDLRCRSVYVPIVRSALYEVFQAFDFADPSVLAGQRESTTVAPQALFMMNSKITAEASRLLAETLRQDSFVPSYSVATNRPAASRSGAGSDDTEGTAHAFEARLDELYYRAYGRGSTAAERARGKDFLQRYTAAVVQRDSASADQASQLAWRALSRAVMAANEFIYVE